MSQPAYDEIGIEYGNFRGADPRIEATIRKALGDAKSVVNVGAGTGSYEPADLQVIAVEPSPVMIEQRPPEAAPAVQGAAGALPLEDDSVAARAEREKMPTMTALEALLPGAAIETVPAPSRCRDEFTSALWDRPELFLEPKVLRASSLWHSLPTEAIERGQARLRADLESGHWDERFGHLRERPELDIGLRIVRQEL